jgi:DNA-binding FadR family transcriptional regulator
MTLDEKPTLNWDAAVRTESLSLSIVRQIRDALYEGKLSPGDFIGSEDSLAKKFGVSRMASRDALRALVAMGIVEIRMGIRGGAWVSTGNLDKLVDALSVQFHLIALTTLELLEAQGAISIMAAELAAARKSHKYDQQLLDAAHQAKISTDNAHAFTTASLDFQECIVLATENRILIAEFKALRSVLSKLLIANTNENSIRRIIKSNTELLNAISLGDVKMAGQIMRERIAGIKAFILNEEH